LAQAVVDFEVSGTGPALGDTWMFRIRRDEFTSEVQYGVGVGVGVGESG